MHLTPQELIELYAIKESKAIAVANGKKYTEIEVLNKVRQQEYFILQAILKNAALLIQPLADFIIQTNEDIQSNPSSDDTDQQHHTGAKGDHD